MELTLEALRQSGVYGHALQTQDDKPEDGQTYANFKLHFTLQEKNRLRNITAKTARFNATVETKTNAHVIPPTDANGASANANQASTTPSYICNEIELFYCWAHGLSKNAAHTSKHCENKATGHINDTTINNCKGGVNQINFGKSGKKNE
jgi:hypothetical protein